MRYYAEFYTDGVKQLGSDALFILDGRNNITTQIDDCCKRITQMRNVKRYNGFAIFCAPHRLFDNRRLLYVNNVHAGDIEI